MNIALKAQKKNGRPARESVVTGTVMLFAFCRHDGRRAAGPVAG